MQHEGLSHARRIVWTAIADGLQVPPAAAPTEGSSDER